MRKTHWRKSYPGTSLPENSLTLGLVVLLCAASLTLAGNGIKNTYTDLASNFSQIFGTAPDPAGSDPATLETLESDTQTQFLPGTKNVEITLADGTRMNLAGYPANLASAVETMGTDGTTRQYARMLQSMAEQLKAQGKIDDAKYQTLLDLSNEGFNIADLQKKQEMALAASHGDLQKYVGLLSDAGFSPNCVNGGCSNDELHFKASAVYDINIPQLGNSVLSERDLYTSLDSPWPTDSILRTLSDSNTSHQERLSGLYLLAERSNALQDPTLRTIVKSATKDLMYLSNASSSSYSAQDVAAFARQSGKEATSICDAGNGSAQSGVDCR